MTVSFQPSDLIGAAETLAPSADAFDALQATPPDPEMYGQLVGSAATDAEPAVTEDLNALLDALGTMVDALAERLRATARSYRATEESNAGLGHSVGSFLGTGDGH